LLKFNGSQRFTATAVSGAISLEETSTSEELTYVRVYEDNSGTITNFSLTVDNACDAKLYDDDTDFIHFDQFLIGDTLGVNMGDFCEVGEIEFNLEREVKPLSSVCGANGRLGYYNSNYTLKITVTTTDILSNRLYNKYKKYIGNETFAIQAQSTNGVSFTFPKCVFEEMPAEDRDGLIGHKFTINCNFDPNTKTMITLPQVLDSTVL
jgi:hypothetical protein